MAHKLLRIPNKLQLEYKMPFLTIGGFVLLAFSVAMVFKSTSDPELIKSIPICLLFAIGCFLANFKTTFEFDLSKRQFIYTKRYLLFKEKRAVVELDQISDIQLISATNSEGTSYKILVTTPNENFLMPDIGQKKDAESYMVEINRTVRGIELASIPIVEQPVLSISTKLQKSSEVVLSTEQKSEVERLLAQKKKLEAIQFVRGAANVDLRKAKLYIDAYKLE